MMIKNTTNMISLDDVLYQFSLEQESPSAELLEEFTHLYPEYAEALTDFAIKWAVEEISVPDAITEVSQDVDDSVSIAMSRFLNKAHEIKSASSKTKQSSNYANHVRNPFAVLGSSEFRTLAQRLNITRLFLSKIRDRIIEASTVPKGFFDLLVKETDESYENMYAHFAVEAELHTDMKFKASGKPTVQGKQSYEEAIESSGLSPEQQSILRNI